MLVTKFYSDFPELEGIQYHDGGEVAAAEKEIKRLRAEKEGEERKKKEKIEDLKKKIKELDEDMIELNNKWHEKFEERLKCRKELAKLTDKPDKTLYEDLLKVIFD